MRFPALLLGLFLFAACQAPAVKKPVGLALARGRYGPPPEEALAVIQVPATNHPRLLERGDILIHSKANAEANQRWVDPEQSADGAKVHLCAALVGAVLDREFQLGFRPGWDILLVSVREGERLEVAGRSRLREGLFAGIPLPEGGVGSQELSYLTTALAHEYSETILGAPDVLGCALCEVAWENRWIGEGIAEWMTSLCEKEIREAGLPIRDRMGASVKALAASAPQAVDLSTWEMNWGANRDKATTKEEEERTILRYLASEYVVQLWYTGAQAQGMQFPVAELARFVASFSAGPSAQDMIRWMEESSGVELGDLLPQVPMVDVLAYHQEKNRFDS
ncbi:MAG: hypothetical protein ACPG31_02840 [Planctomycetota bacterium]